MHIVVDAFSSPVTSQLASLFSECDFRRWRALPTHCSSTLPQVLLTGLQDSILLAFYQRHKLLKAALNYGSISNP